MRPTDPSTSQRQPVGSHANRTSPSICSGSRPYFANDRAGESRAELCLRFSSDEKARAALEEELFGKRILCTDKTRKAASTATIVVEYRS